jgi:hypothetical protein
MNSSLQFPALGVLCLFPFLLIVSAGTGHDSSQIVWSERDYGSIGVVMVLLSYLIAIGVCLHLGAVVGRAWSERSHQPSATPAETTNRPIGSES